MRRRLAVGLLCAALPACTPSPPPNLVLILADDLGYRDLGFMGSEVARTPHLDRLAAEGTVFSVGYSTASVCRPALRTLLTGLHPVQYQIREQWLAEQGIPSSPAAPVIRSMATLPRLLAARGYASFQAGKHFEGPYAAAGFSEGMNPVGGRVGFDAGVRLVRETVEPVYDFLERQRETPFFLWFAPMIPHVPHDPPREFRLAYRDARVYERLRVVAARRSHDSGPQPVGPTRLGRPRREELLLEHPP